MEKQFVSVQKYVQTTPRKLRLVSDAVRKMTPASSLEVLPYSSKRAAGPLWKVIKAAVSNAKQQGVEDTNLIFHEIQITQGPVLKRFMAVSRGQAHGYKKRMSHVRVVLKEAQKVETTKVEEKKVVVEKKQAKTKSKK